MFRQEEFMGRRVLKSSLLDGEDVVAFFTTRDLPLKAGEREDLIDEVEQNKKLICEGFDIPLENLVIPVQTHSDNVGIIKRTRRQEGERASCHCEGKCNFDEAIQKENLSTHRLIDLSTFENTDALITDQPQIALALNFADCVPIIFYDPVKKVSACAHAGWRGTVAQIGMKTVQKMVSEFGCEAKNIIALIGPAIGKCCFEVGDDVKEKLQNSIDAVGLASPTYFLQKSQPSNPPNLKTSKIDLKQINKLQLLAMGIEKIDVCEYCTSCQNELFFSYRKENGNCARHSAVIKVNCK